MDLGEAFLRQYHSFACGRYTSVRDDAGVAVLLVLQLQKFTELSAIFLHGRCHICELVQDAQVFQEEAERVAALVPVVGTVITTETRQQPHGSVSILSIVQVGGVGGTFLQGNNWISWLKAKWCLVVVILTDPV